MSDVIKLYTIGYGNRQPEELLKIFKDNGIGAVIDLRKLGSKSWLRTYWAGQPSGESRMENWLFVNGITYYHWYPLANIYDSLEEFRKSLSLAHKKVLISALADYITEDYKKEVCFLCAEIDHTKCHRSIIAEELHKMYGFEVVHL